MSDLGDIERMVTDWERNAAEKAQRFADMQQRVEQISITESVASGAVSVTVGSNGIPTNVAMTDAVRSMSPDEIAANVLRAMQKAQSKYPERLAEITAETVGDDETTRHLVSTAQAQFPEMPDEDDDSAQSPPSDSGRTFRVGVQDDDEEAEPPRSQTPPPPRRRQAGDRGEDDDGDDFGGQSVLR